MIKDKSVLALIPARGGSKGIVRKNLREVAGKPLIAWTIEQAKQSKYIDRLILSSDDQEIISVAEEWGCEVPFVRPDHLAQDDSLTIDTIIHAIDHLPNYDLIVLLQPTSPLRNAEDIDTCIEICLEKQAKACVSVCEASKSPFWMFTLDQEQKMKPLIPFENEQTNRHNLPKAYVLNGAVYVSYTDWVYRNKSFFGNETVSYIMPAERSIDIDSEIDLRMVEWLLSQQPDAK